MQDLEEFRIQKCNRKIVSYGRIVVKIFMQYLQIIIVKKSRTILTSYDENVQFELEIG